jgi:hypothetical protein
MFRVEEHDLYCSQKDIDNRTTIMANGRMYSLSRLFIGCIFIRVDTIKIKQKYGDFVSGMALDFSGKIS